MYLLTGTISINFFICLMHFSLALFNFLILWVWQHCRDSRLAGYRTPYLCKIFHFHLLNNAIWNLSTLITTIQHPKISHVAPSRTRLRRRDSPQQRCRRFETCRSSNYSTGAVKPSTTTRPEYLRRLWKTDCVSIFG